MLRTAQQANQAQNERSELEAYLRSLSPERREEVKRNYLASLHESVKQAALQPQQDRNDLEMLRERFNKLSPAEKREVLSVMLKARADAYCEALDQREAQLMSKLPADPSKASPAVVPAQPQNIRTTPKSVATPPTVPAAKRPAEPADARPGQSSNSKMSTASRQPARAPLQALQTAPAPAKQQPVKAAPALQQGVFKITPAEMAKRVSAESDKLIVKGAQAHVEMYCPTPQNQTAQEKKKREQVVQEAAKMAKKLLQKPEHARHLDKLTEAATANVKLALGYPEDAFWKQMRESDNESAIERVRDCVLENERVESVVASSIRGLKR